MSKQQPETVTTVAWTLKHLPPGFGAVPGNFKLEADTPTTLAAVARFTAPGQLGTSPILDQLRQQAETSLKDSPPAAAVVKAEATAQNLRTKVAALDAKIAEASRKREDPALLEADNAGETLLQLDAEIKVAGTHREATQRAVALADKQLSDARAVLQHAIVEKDYQLRTEAVKKVLAERADLLAQLAAAVGPVLSKLLENEKPFRVLCADALASDNAKERNMPRASVPAPKLAKDEDDEDSTGQKLAPGSLPSGSWCGGSPNAAKQAAR